MKEEECVVGVKVYSEDGPAYQYEITSLPDEEGRVGVKPIDRSYTVNPIPLDHLYLYNEDTIQKAASDLQEKVDKATSAFEEAFNQLREVRKYREMGLSRWSLEDLGLLNLEKLETTIDNGGWRSSSLWC